MISLFCFIYLLFLYYFFSVFVFSLLNFFRFTPTLWRIVEFICLHGEIKYIYILRIAGQGAQDLVRNFLIESSPKGVRLKGNKNEPRFGELCGVYSHQNTLPSLLVIAIIIFLLFSTSCFVLNFLDNTEVVQFMSIIKCSTVISLVLFYSVFRGLLFKHILSQ